MTEITDPAHELSELWEHLRSLSAPDATAATSVLLADAMGVRKDSLEFFELIGAISARVSALADFVTSTTDPQVYPATRKHVRKALTRMGQLPKFLGGQWRQAFQEALREEDMVTCELFSSIVRRHRPLRKLNEEDRESALASLDSAIAELDQDDTIPGWARSALADGLRRVRMVLAHLRFFGHDQALDEILLTSHRAVTVQRKLEDQGQTSSESGGIRKALNALALLITFFSAPAVTSDAFLTYKGWMLQAVQSELPKPETLLITYRTAIPPQEDEASGDLGATDAK